MLKFTFQFVCMKKILFFIIFFAFVTNANAQYPKLIVQFKNKAGGSGNTFANPSGYLSAKAVQRRTKYNIAIDSIDIPVSKQYTNTVIAQGPVTLLSRSKWLNQILIQCTDATTINKIMALPFVRSVQAIGNRVQQSQTHTRFIETTAPLSSSNINRNMNTTASDAFDYGNSYGQIHLHEGEFLHNKGFRGETITIAVLDAGFYNYTTNKAFDSVRNAGQILGVRDFVAFDNSVIEDDTHGMHCASIMASNIPGQLVGSSPKASYWFLRSENVVGEYPIEEHNWVVAAEFADSVGADMISSSLGYFTFDDASFDHNYSQFYGNKTMVSIGASTAAKKGLIVMNSAGNEGQSAWKYLGFPADSDSVCAVGAVDVNKNIAGFSSYGYPGKVKPNVASVGAGTIIASTVGTPVSGNGTSYSNPNMAGLVACLWQAFPQYNNMKILDALYKSADHYTAPTDRVGFGIPNMKTAYRFLKHDQNVALYGPDWLFVTPAIFTNIINVKLIGQIDGAAKLELINAQGIIIGTHNLTTELEEVYDDIFLNLDNLPGGTYTIKYTDANKTRSINVTKTGSVVTNLPDWFMAGENNIAGIFRNHLQVYLQAPETAKATIRLIDAKGSIIESIEQNLTQNSIYNLNFNNSIRLAKGVYFIEFKNAARHRTIRVVKQ